MILSEGVNPEDVNKNYKLLQKIGSEIKLSWIRDCDKTDEMKALNKIIENILNKNESLEEALNQNEKLVKYFMTDFMNEVISNIIIQPIIYGYNGDDIALELLFSIYKLFMKFHKNKKYSPLFEKIRDIINTDKASGHFFSSLNEQKNQTTKIENPKRKYNYTNFNHQFCKEYIDKIKENEKILKEKDNIDLLIKYERSRTHIDKTAWIRAKIKSVDKENYNYVIESPYLNSDLTISIGCFEISPEGTKTKDWEWRKNLKKYDLIDCYDRNTWYPATICEVNEEIKENDEKKVRYKVGFRLYPKYFKNKNDENDKYENYKRFWERNELELEEKTNEEFFGDKESFDEIIDFYSKRIQKFQSYTNVQREYLSQPTQYSAYGSFNKAQSNKMQIMNYELENDNEGTGISDDMFIYEKDGKRNYIIGKTSNFSYYYALFLKRMADENFFEEFIKIINNKPNSEEIFNILYTLYYALPYLHRQYLIENLDNFKNSIIYFINNLETKEIRNLPKDLIEMISKFLKRVDDIIKEGEVGNNETKYNIVPIINQITISLSIKMIKTSIFDKRIQGIKSLNEYINENKNKSDLMKILVDLIQKNDIIKEIFGANYHSQIISKSDKILSLLLKNNEIKEEDIKLIWDCTQRGDLEAKTTIMKLLSDLAENLNENFINILLQNIINTIDQNKINEKEIDFIYNLSIHGDNENNTVKFCEYLYQCILKLDLVENIIQKNSIMEKLVMLTGKNDKYLSKVLSMCGNDLISSNCSLSILQILSALFGKYIINSNELVIIKDSLKEFINDDNLLNSYKKNFNDYILRIRELIKAKNKPDEIGNYDDMVVDNYSHVINIQKRIEFLKDWISVLYPKFDFVPFLKSILLDKPISINDEAIFYEFMKKYISEFKINETDEQRERRDNIKNQLFKIFVENNQSSMTLSEFKLFIAIFLGINNSNIYYNLENNDNYNIHVLGNLEEIKELDKLWNVIFQLKDEKVLNKAISIIFDIYKSKDQISKLLNKCNELIKDEKTKSEVIDKCFKLLRIIIIESEKNNITKAKSHLNLIKNSVIYLPLKITQKYPNIYENFGIEDEPNDSLSEIFYGNTTLNEIKELLIQKGKIPLKYIEVSLSKEYMTKLKEIENKNKEKNSKEKDNKNEESELLLDETYNNKSIIEILNNNYNLDLAPNKIFIFYKKNIERTNLLEGNELNPKLKEILKEWYNEFTEGTGKMDSKSCSRYISKVTKTREVIPDDDVRIKSFFQQYDPDRLGYVTEDKFIEFYQDSLKEKKDNIVWENIKAMGIREDLHKSSEIDEIPYIDNNKLPRYCLGNDKLFIETLFNLYNKLDNKKDIFEFLFFLSTNKEIYDNILNNLNKSEEKNFEKIYEESNNILEQLYTLTIIESILQDIKVSTMDFSGLFEECKKNDNSTKNNIIMKSKNYEYYDEIDINIKKKFLKEFITSKNYEKLLKYMDKLLVEYKVSNNEKDNIVLNTCLEKCLKVVSILYNACFNNNINKEKQNNTESKNIANNNGILLLDYSNLPNIFNEDNNIKDSISQISFLEFITNLIKFITNISKDLDTYELSSDYDSKILHNSFNLLINLISYNNKLLQELDSKEDIKQMLSKLIKDAITSKNEHYKSFYINCLINSTKNILSQKDEDNKFLNLLFVLTNNIFNEMISEQSKNNDNINSKSSILFFDFFSLLSSAKTDNIGNEYLFKIYDILFNNLKEYEKEKKISNDIFIGLMNILTRRIKNNINTKKEIINREIEGKTLIDLIFEKLFKTEEKDKKELIPETANNDKDNSKFINLDLIQKDETQKNNIMPKEIKDICNNYLIESFKSSKDSKIIKIITSIINIFILKQKGSEEEEGLTKHHSSLATKNYGHVGLKNIGCICYMNSIIQQMYMVPTFRYAIMGSDDHEEPKPSENGRLTIEDDNLLHQLQNMYTFLTYSEKEDYNPKNFCYSFKDFDGNPINPIIQQDSQEFYNNFCDKIENCLKKTKYKYIINDVFTGRTCSSVICESCKNVSNRFEDFYNLTLEVKNITTLDDSLQKMIMPEKIDDFKCSNCNQKVTISKITSLSNLPNVLVIQLKRFYMNYEIERTEKINSRFEFPFELNLKKFCIEDIVKQISNKNIESEDIYVKDDEYYNYILKGINIHMGSADGGHYFSLINVERDGTGNILMSSENSECINNTSEDKKNKWLKFNDSHISIFDINDIEKECFGGAPKGSSYNFENFQNAYMLIYERKKKSPIRILYEDNEIKEFDTKKNSENIVKINNDNRQKIKKQYDLNQKNGQIDESTLYQKIFNDEEKKELYKYIPYYSINKYAPREIYNQVMEKNKIVEKKKNSSDSDDAKYNKEYIEILLNNISSNEFDVLSDNYDDTIKNDLIQILLQGIFNLASNNFTSEDEKKEINSKTKIILEKIIMPFIEANLKNEQIQDIIEQEDNSITENSKKGVDFFLNIIKNILIQKEKIYINDITSVFDSDNVELFSKIIKGILEIYYKKNHNRYISIIEELYNLVRSIDSTSTYPTVISSEVSRTPIIYIYELLYKAALEDKKTVEKLINSSAISTLLGKLSSENALCRGIIFDIVTHLIKNTYEYNDKLFDVKDNEKKAYFYEKNDLIKSITSSIVELLFEERLELLIILIKMLQYDEMNFSSEFNLENVYQLFEYSIKKNKIKDMMKVLFAILEINDKYTFSRINYILGYPTMIIKQIKNKTIDIKDNHLYEEQKADEEDKKEMIEKENINYWPLFGERLIMEDNGGPTEKIDNELKLKRHIYKYIGVFHKKENYCILPLLFPENKNDNEGKDNNNQLIIDEKDRKKYIYDLLKLMLIGKGNYCIFKYIYLLPARSLYYKNLYEEMIDILEEDNKINNNLYNLTDIKKNADICIKRINYEVNIEIKNFENNDDISFDDYKYKLPEIMEKYYIKNNDVENFIGVNPNMIESDIVKEEITIIGSGQYMRMIRLEYFTKYKTPDEIRNILINSKEEKKSDKNEEEQKLDIPKEKKVEEEIEEKKEKNEENKKLNDKDSYSDDDNGNGVFKIDVSKIKKEIDGKEFMFDLVKRIESKSMNKIVIEDSSINNKNGIKSSLIRFVILNYQSSDSDMNIKISHKNTPYLVSHNFYYPHFFVDNIKKMNISIFMNVNRIRNNIPFLKSNDIEINIEVKKPREYEL